MLGLACVVDAKSLAGILILHSNIMGELAALAKSWRLVFYTIVTNS